MAILTTQKNDIDQISLLLGGEKVRYVPKTGCAYCVSERGRVFQLKFGRWIEMNPSPDQNNRRRLGVRFLGKGHTVLTVARLVALTFLGDPPKPSMQALHKNDIPFDDHYKNIYWGTRKQNIDDAIRNGKIRPRKSISAILAHRIAMVYPTCNNRTKWVRGIPSKASKCLCAWMARNDMTITQLARQLDCTVGRAKSILEGRSAPNVFQAETVKKIAGIKTEWWEEAARR